MNWYKTAKRNPLELYAKQLAKHITYNVINHEGKSGDADENIIWDIKNKVFEAYQENRKHQSLEQDLWFDANILSLARQDIEWYENNSYKKEFYLGSDNRPNIRNIYVTVVYRPLSLDKLNGKSGTGIVVEGSFDDWGFLNIHISTLRTLDRREYSELYKKILEVCRHELEHSKQNLFENDKETVFEVQDRLMNSRRKYGIDRLKDYAAYLTYPHEIEAFVSGAYLVAKTGKIPFMQALQQMFDEKLGSLYQDVTADPNDAIVADRIRNSVINAWMQYAKERYPNISC